MMRKESVKRWLRNGLRDDDGLRDGEAETKEKGVRRGREEG